MRPQRFGRLLAALAGVVAVAGLPAVVAHADDVEFVKYYTVTSAYQGRPENLTEIAGRLLGDGGRSNDLFNLNAGRAQPDGGTLTDPAALHAGWYLVLPFDAGGAGVQYGTLPTTPPPAGSAGAPAPPSSPAAPSRGGKAAPGNPAGQPAQPARPPGSASGLPAAGQPPVSPTTAPKASGAPAVACANVTAAAPASGSWAFDQLKVDGAWSTTRGKGALVAVVDSGVDGGLPTLAGHIAVGVDVVAGSGRGDADCLGTGTAMAGIVVAQPQVGSPIRGMAPDATVMPVRVVTTTTAAHPDDEAAAIKVAVASGATVVALGSYVDIGDAAVVRAVADAVDHDVVVLAPAPAKAAPGSAAGPLPASGVLRVGAVNAKGVPVAPYRPDAVDVLAPGGAVPSLGLTGRGTVVVTGTQYAVAFAAGEAALVRSAYPNLSAGQVTHRMTATASRVAGGATTSPLRPGTGMISPASAVTAVVPGERAAGQRRGTAAQPPSRTSGGRVLYLVVALLVLAVAVTLVVIRARRLLRTDSAEEGALSGDPD
jgi:membrane-anchored mycosin MYCP